MVAMMKRWFIRSIFILPILFCVAGWAWSGWYSAGFDYMQECHGVQGGTQSGVIYLIYGDRTGSWSNGFHYRVGRRGRASFWPEYNPLPDFNQFLRCSLFTFGGTFGFDLEVPYWFPIVECSLALLLVWRSAHPRQLGQGFPVEMATMEGS